MVDKYRSEGKLVVAMLPSEEVYTEKVGNRTVKKTRFVVKPYD